MYETRNKLNKNLIFYLWGQDRPIVVTRLQLNNTFTVVHGNDSNETLNYRDTRNLREHYYSLVV